MRGVIRHLLISCYSGITWKQGENPKESKINGITAICLSITCDPMLLAFIGFATICKADFWACQIQYVFGYEWRLRCCEFFELVSTADANAMQENLITRDAFTSDNGSTLECGSTVEPCGLFAVFHVESCWWSHARCGVIMYLWYAHALQIPQHQRVEPWHWCHNSRGAILQMRGATLVPSGPFFTVFGSGNTHATTHTFFLTTQRRKMP